MKIERQIVIHKPKEEVFNYLKSIKNVHQWNPWSRKDPNIQIVYKGSDGSVGSMSSWSGNKATGAGEQEITRIASGERVDFELRFMKPMKATNTGYYATESLSDSQTKVRWGMEGKSKFPFNVICALMGVNKMLEREFDNGLQNLKRILED